jgi:hypothetical protein
MTTQEYRAKAMLLDMWYEKQHHLICNQRVSVCLDPDTLEKVWDDDPMHDQSRFTNFLIERHEKFKSYHRR